VAYGHAHRPTGTERRCGQPASLLQAIEQALAGFDLSAALRVMPLAEAFR
jgi:hypothetical protein